jgi:MFS family permease
LASTGHPNAAFVAAAVFGIQKTFYWPGFHSVMARYAQTNQMGKAFGTSYAIISLANIAGPMAGGLVAQRFGLPGGFLMAAIVYCCSIFPLLMAQEIFVPKVYRFRDTWELYKTYPKKFLGYMGFGEELLFLTVWPIFIYTVVKDYRDVGVLVTAASFVAAALALVIGKISDQYTKRILIRIGAFFTALIWLARFVATTALNTFGIDSLARTAKETYFIPLSTLVYLRAEATHVVPYAVFFEQSLAVGKLATCLLGMLLFYLTGSFMVLFILGGLLSLLYMYI